MRLVIIGLGYSSRAIARELAAHCKALHVTARSEEKVARLCAEGFDALRFDGSALPIALTDALGAATHLLISAPPGEVGDPLIAAPGFPRLAMPALRRVIYLSTVGVYGDHDGAWVDEETELRPVSQRSHQRVMAEQQWHAFSGARKVDLGIFRLSGIYGPGRSAIDTLRAGTARRIVKPGQVFNRIHVEDIAGAITLAMAAEGSLGVFNLTDDVPSPPQDVVAYAAGLLGVAPPPEIPFALADLTPMARSFYGENKRVSNARLKQVLGYRFRHPSYREGISACLSPTQEAPRR